MQPLYQTNKFAQTSTHWQIDVNGRLIVIPFGCALFLYFGVALCFKMSQMSNEGDSVCSSEDLDNYGPEQYLNVTGRTPRRIRNKVTSEWSEYNTLTLIAAVEERDCLWNTSHEDYKSREVRGHVWADIYENVFNREIDIGQLGAKWTNLRIQYKSYHAKAKRGPVSWKYYPHMIFLAAVQEEQYVKSDTKPAQIFLTEPEIPCSNVSSESTVSAGLNNRKRKKKISRSLPDNDHSTENNVIPEKVKSELPNLRDHGDSFQAFGNFVAAELRKLPDSLVANRIQRTLTRTLMDLLDQADAEDDKPSY
ncbi:uncharacterized protein LOC134227824 [Armigeres subalbatus]|uniref:uncharacterized protein LOC134227824 n=1 Tax=Armigeres subalbatus TaxID=124917 RepID=UPI002ED10E5D